MQVSTKRRFVISLDEDEAEEFLGNPEALQSKVREQLRANGNGHTAYAKPESALHQKARAVFPALGRKPKSALPKASGKGRRPLRKTPCPECGKELPGHWLVRHRQKVHGVVPTVEIESQE